MTGPSPIWRPFPTELPPIEYAPGAVGWRGQAKGETALHGQYDPVGWAFPGYRVTVQLCHATIAKLDLTQLEACYWSTGNLSTMSPVYTQGRGHRVPR